MEATATTAQEEQGGGSETARKTIKFQCGLLRETETFAGEDLDILCKDTLLEYVCDMLNNKFPEHPYGDLLDKVLLYKHSDRDAMVPLESDDIEDGCIIEIVLKAHSKQEYDDVICPHILTVNTYRTPGIFCDYCGILLFGLLKQGLKCEGCDNNYHKKCAYRVPNNCTRLKGADGISNPPIYPRSDEVWSGRPLWIDRTLKSRRHVPHTFFIHSTKKPTQCYHCKKLLKGMFRQGMKCKDCNINVHRRCAKEIGNNCAGETPSLNRVDSGEWTMATIARHVIANEYSEDLHDNASNSDAGRAPSTISEEAREDSPLSTSSGQDHPEPDGYVTTSSTTLSAPMGVITEEPSGGEDTTSNEGSEHNSSDPVAESNIKLQRVTGVSMRHTKAPSSASVLKEGWMVHYTNKSNVRKKHFWRLDTKCLTFYKTETSSSYFIEISLVDILAVDPMTNPEIYPLQPPHVFDVVTSSMTYYVGVDMSNAHSQDLKPQSEVEGTSVNVLGDVSHLSLSALEELGVGLGVGIAWEDALHNALMPITPQASMGSLADIGVGVGGLRPSSFRKGRGSLRGSLRGSFRGNSFRGSTRGRKGSMRGSFRVPKQSPGVAGTPPSTRPSNTPSTVATIATTSATAPTIVTTTATPSSTPSATPWSIPSSTSSIKQPKVETKMDISLFYQIFPEEILGSGQFGTVYGGQSRQTSKAVAVKVIDKLRFPHKHESQLRIEVTILQTLSHPGIIFLEHMFETPEKIYVVMEKMNGDMLEMILNSENSRLTERLTKYMIYQILVALQYLHKKDIVHCDLKPENVLLTSETGLPQAKLCDFGFARIIGEKSFRKSIVGTPAYLAPEVLKSEGYNRSLDLWSVGVIVYVSLSGTFPFNEDEDISDQIHNASFMYPPDPWDTISKDAVDLINRLLQVSRKSRFKTLQALHHSWLGEDKTLWEDLCQLEGLLGMRYLTHESEDNFWTSHGAKPHPLAEVEEEKREQSRLEHQKAVALSVIMAASNSNQKVVKFSEDQDVAVVVNGDTSPSSSARNSGLCEEGEGEGEGDRREAPRDDTSSNSSGGSKRDYVHLSDPDIVRAQEHAKRVGYKVTTL